MNVEGKVIFGYAWQIIDENNYVMLLLFLAKDKNKPDVYMYENKEWTWREMWFFSTRDNKSHIMWAWDWQFSLRKTNTAKCDHVFRVERQICCLLFFFVVFFLKSWHFSTWNKINLKSICLFGIQIVREYSCRFLKIACNSEDHYRAVYCYYYRVITLSLNVQHGYIATIKREKKPFSPNPILNSALQRNVVWVSLKCSQTELFKFNILLT